MCNFLYLTCALHLNIFKYISVFLSGKHRTIYVWYYVSMCLVNQSYISINKEQMMIFGSVKLELRK